MARDQTEEAEERARRLMERYPASADAHRLLGHLLGEAGHFDEAVKHVERSIALEPQSVSDYAGLVAWRRLTEADRPLVARMLSRLGDRDLSETDRMSVHFALGKALDDLKDYEGATRHFDAANRIRYRLCRFDRKEFEQRIDALIARFTGGILRQQQGDRQRRRNTRPGSRHAALRHDLDRAYRLQPFAGRRWRRTRVLEPPGPALVTAATDKRPDFSAEALERAERRPTRPGDDVPVLIIGMPRSGTTLVEQILSSHPSVAAGGELSFWSERVRQWLARSAETGGPAGPALSAEQIRPPYPSLAAGGDAGDRSGGSSDWLPTRFGQVEADALAQAAEDYLAALRAIGPDALRVTDKAPTNFERLGPILVAVPKARVIHCRRHPVDTCLSIFFTSLKSRLAWNRADLVFQYRQYERLMEHWRSALPANRFTEVEYETLIADREAETRRLVAFCGLEWNEACLAPERNARVVTTASVWQARQPVYKTSLQRWRRYEPWLGELRELLPATEKSPEGTGCVARLISDNADMIAVVWTGGDRGR